MAEQLALIISEVDGLPPAQDLKALIREEHHRAELERLRAGYEGCGCAECQDFYLTLDLSLYGERVKRYAGLISVVEGRSGADLWGKYHPGPPTANPVPPVAGNTPPAADSSLKSWDINAEQGNHTTDIIVTGLAIEPTAQDGGKRGRPRSARDLLPVTRIKELRSDGLSARSITERLEFEGFMANYRTVGRLVKELNLL